MIYVINFIEYMKKYRKELYQIGFRRVNSKMTFYFLMKL